MKNEPVKKWLSRFPFIYNLLKKGRCMYQTYRELPTILPCKLRYCKALLENRFKQKTIIMYPDLPQSYHLFYKIAHVLGHRMTNNPNKRADMVIAFEDTTVRENNRHLVSLSQHCHVINYRCRDISKTTVDTLFESTFGYGISLEPTTYTGIAVKKSNYNAQHDGEVIICPIERNEEGYVYQKLIDCQEGDEIVVHYRVPIFKQTIPFVFVKYRRITNRFGRYQPSNIKTEMVEAQEIFSHQEVDSIFLFCQEIGLDMGDLDVLRDKNDGRLYIVDANNTPAWPTSGLRKEETEQALRRLAITFEKTIWSGQ